MGRRGVLACTSAMMQHLPLPLEVQTGPTWPASHALDFSSQQGNAVMALDRKQRVYFYATWGNCHDVQLS